MNNIVLYKYFKKKIKKSRVLRHKKVYTNKIEDDIIRKFTIKSKETGCEYTYKLRKTRYQGHTYTHIYVEYNYLKWYYLGYYEKGRIKRKKGKFSETKSANAIAWVLRNTEKLIDISEKVEIYGLGLCSNCGHVLTDSNSIKLGIGPICKEHIITYD